MALSETTAVESEHVNGRNGLPSWPSSLLLFVFAVSMERALALWFPTTWEWDVLTRALKAAEVADQGFWAWMAAAPRTDWLPGYPLVIGWLLRELGGNPVVIAEWVSAVSMGVIVLGSRRLAQLLLLSERQQWWVVALLLSSGHLLSYGAKGMTEAPSVAAFVVSLVALLEFRNRRRWPHAVFAAIAMLVHASLRWEGVMYAAILPALVWWGSSSTTWPRLRDGTALLLTALPTAAFLAAFLAYTKAMVGRSDHVIEVVAAVQAGDPMFFHRQPIYSALYTVAALLLASGTLWIAPLLHAVAVVRRKTDAVPPGASRTVGAVAAFHVLWFWAFAVSGLSSGWSRHLLYLVPLLAVLTVAWARSPRALRVHAVLSVCLGLLALADNRYRHLLYVNGHLRANPAPPGISIPRQR